MLYKESKAFNRLIAELSHPDYDGPVNFKVIIDSEQVLWEKTQIEKGVDVKESDCEGMTLLERISYTKTRDI